MKQNEDDTKPIQRSRNNEKSTEFGWRGLRMRGGGEGDEGRGEKKREGVGGGRGGE